MVRIIELSGDFKMNQEIISCKLKCVQMCIW